MEEIQYIQSLEKQYQSYQINGVLLNNNINNKQLQMSPKMTYSKFANNVWECVGEFVRLTSQKKSFCEYFFEFICQKFGGDRKLVKFFFTEALSILTYNDSEENKYMSILLVKEGKNNFQ